MKSPLAFLGSLQIFIGVLLVLFIGGLNLPFLIGAFGDTESNSEGWAYVLVFVFVPSTLGLIAGIALIYAGISNRRDSGLRMKSPLAFLGFLQVVIGFLFILVFGGFTLSQMNLIFSAPSLGEGLLQYLLPISMTAGGVALVIAGLSNRRTERK